MQYDKYIIIGHKMSLHFFISFDTLTLLQFPNLKALFIQVAGVFIRESMIDAISVEGFRDMDVEAAVM